MEAHSLRAGCAGFEPYNTARAIPNLYVTPVDELLGFLCGFLIVGALNNFRRYRNVAVLIDEIDAICGHDRRSTYGHPRILTMFFVTVCSVSDIRMAAPRDT